jgi:hypothetical protein
MKRRMASRFAAAPETSSPYWPNFLPLWLSFSCG